MEEIFGLMPVGGWNVLRKVILLLFVLLVFSVFASTNNTAEDLSQTVIEETTAITILPVEETTLLEPELSAEEPGLLATTLSFVATKVITFIGDIVQLEAILTYENITPIPDRKVDFYADDFIGSDTTDEQGSAVVEWDTSLWLPGAYRISAQYPGNGAEKPSNAEHTITLEDLPTTEDETQTIIQPSVTIRNKDDIHVGDFTFENRDDGTFDLTVVHGLNRMEIKGLESLEVETEIDYEDFNDSEITTEVIAVDFMDFIEDFEEATITLAKTGNVSVILHCPSFDMGTFECEDWQETSLPFTQTDDTVTFTVTHFTAYAGGVAGNESYTPSVASGEEYELLGYKYSNSSNIVISTHNYISCSWKPDSSDDGRKNCEAVLGVENQNQIAPMIAVPQVLFTFQNNNILNQITTFSNTYSTVTETIRNGQNDLNNKYTELTDTLTRREFSNFGAVPTAIDTSQPFAIRVAYDAPKYSGNQFSMDIRATGFSAFIDPTQSSCGALNSAGTYTLTQNLTSVGTCFVINSSNMALNCAGYAVTYSTGAGIGYGVDNTGGFDNVTIENCLFTEGNSSTNQTHAIFFNNGAINGFIRNNTITGSGGFSVSIRLENTSNSNTVTGNTITTSGQDNPGILVFTSDSNIIRSNTITASGLNAEGIFLTDTNSSLIESNTIDTVTGIGIRVYSTVNSRNTLRNNDITSTLGDEIGDESGSSYVNYLVYNNSWGEIFWTDNSSSGFLRNLTLNGSIALGINLFIGNNTAAANTSAFSGSRIDSRANITLNSLSFSSVAEIRRMQSYNINSSYILNNGNVCNDCSVLSYDNSTGRLEFNTTDIGSFAASNASSSFVITIGSPANNSLFDDGYGIFQFTVTEPNAGFPNCSLTINGTVNKTRLVVRESVDEYFRVDGLDDGSYSWNISCTDIAGTTLSSDTRIFSTIDTTPPEIYLRTPINTTNETDGNVRFGYFVRDHGYAIANCSLLINSTLNQTNTTIQNREKQYFTISGMSNGDYNWSIRCYDTSPVANNNVSEEIFTVNIERIPPVITLQSPANGSIDTGGDITFTYDVYDNNFSVERCDFFFDGSLNQTDDSIIESYPQTFVVNGTNSGTHTWWINCVDDTWYNTPGYSASWEVTLIPDNSNPTISLDYPWNGITIRNSNNINFIYNTSDNLGIRSCSLILNGVTNTTDTNITVNTLETITQTLPNGNYNWGINCTDNSDNSNIGNSSTRSLVIDTAPNVTLVSPISGSQDSNGMISLNYSVTDNLGIINCTFYTTINGSWEANFSNTLVQMNRTLHFELEGVRDDTSFIWNVLCYDTERNPRWGSSNFSLLVNNTPPNVSIIPSVSWGEDNYTIINLSRYFTDVNNDSIGYTSTAPENISVRIDNSTDLATLESDKNWFGSRSITFYAYDGIENTSSNSVSITVNELGDTAPWIRNQSPAHNFNDTDGYLFLNCNVTDDYNVVNVSLYHNVSGIWQVNQTRSTSGREVSPTFNVTSLTDGSYLWNCLTYDNSSQSVWGENRTVEVGIIAGIDHHFPSRVVNNVNASFFLWVDYSSYLNGSLVLGNLSIIELDDNAVYFSVNMSNNTGYISEDSTVHTNSIEIIPNNLFDGNFTVGNSVNLNITFNYYYQGNSYWVYENTTMEIVE